MIHKNLLSALLAVLTAIGLAWIQPALAALPPGNAVKDPYAILRNALPIEQKDLREIQHKLEDTSDLVRGNRWPSLAQTISSSKFLLNSKSQKILEEIPKSKSPEAKKLFELISQMNFHPNL